MAKTKNTRKTPPQAGVVTGADYPSEDVKWWREAVEGLVIAIVLALLIRGFEAEAFVIPTGSMAPTLQGRHKDVICEQCQHHYRAGSSLDNELRNGQVVRTTCPMCFYPMELTYEKARDFSYTGDRILVNKFAFDVTGRPERFDVIVFKNPGNAKQNYIKRLCGLPGEEIKLFRGDIYVRKDGEADFTIARKPPVKLRTLLQLVHDSSHLPLVLDENGLPPRWQVQPGADAWSTPDNGRTFALAATDAESWVRYRHIVPDVFDWLELTEENTRPVWEDTRGELITDFYAYNAYLCDRESVQSFFERAIGKNWVGDLAVECDVEVASDAGQFSLDLVEGGWHFRCTIDVATGEATCSINGGDQPFDESNTVSAATNVSGPGTYRIYFSNADNELRLWVNDSLCTFDAASTYPRPDADTMRPVHGGPEDPGDLAPVGVGGRNLQAELKRMRIYRDVYYVAVKGRVNPLSGDYELRYPLDQIVEVLRSPEQWSTTPLFDHMRSVQFKLRDFDDDRRDQFFPMGDNSPQSEDARIWNADRHVERQFLIGEAVVIYWPHPWHVKLPGTQRTFPLLPNVTRMGIIH